MPQKRNEIKAIAVDLDKTLLNDDYVLSRKNANTIRELKARGIILIVATGRMLSAVYRCLGDSIKHFDYIACYNGASIVRVSDGQTILTRHLSAQDLESLLNELNGNQYNAVVFNGDQVQAKFVNADDELLRYYVARTNANIQPMKFPHHINFQSEKILAYDMDVTKKYSPYVMKFEEEALFQKLQNSNGGNNFSIKKTELGYLEISAQNVNKFQALDWILKNEGLEFHHLVALGDGFNDLEMIENAGVGIAVENAVEELKAIASFVCLSNHDDGFSDAMRRLELIN